MITGVGTDIVEIGRIREALERHGIRFLERILTTNEIAYCMDHAQPATRVAARFAAKEAVAKALGCGIGAKLSWDDMEIVHDAAGKPSVVLSPAARQRHNNPILHVSLSHSRDYATAMAIVSR